MFLFVDSLKIQRRFYLQHLKLHPFLISLYPLSKKELHEHRLAVVEEVEKVKHRREEREREREEREKAMEKARREREREQNGNNMDNEEKFHANIL